MTRAFDWKPERDRGIWRHGSPFLRPLVAAAPWVTVGLLLLIFHLIGGTLVSEKGALFDLPEAGLADGEATGPVALLVPNERDTMVFFDDARYLLGDESSVASLSEHLKEARLSSNRKTLLALADRRIPTGDILRFTTLVRESGISRVLFAERKREEEE